MAIRFRCTHLGASLTAYARFDDIGLAGNIK